MLRIAPRPQPRPLPRPALLKASLLLILAGVQPRHATPLQRDQAGACSAALSRARPAAAATAGTCAAAMPTQRQPGEWESPITSELITSAVRQG